MTAVYIVTTRDGTVLPCTIGGDAHGVPMVMLHGYTDSACSFEPLAGSLPSSVSSIAITQRGHGDAAKPAKGYRLADFSHDVCDAMDQLGIPRAWIVGHSMGSLVAQRFAADRPDRVLGLVLISAFRSMHDNPVVEAFWQQNVASLVDPVDPAMVREFQVSCIARPVAETLLDTMIGESLKVPARVWRETLRNLRAEDCAVQATRIRAPTLIVWGDRDPFSQRPDQDYLFQAIRGARLVVHEGVGHAPHWEDPARVAHDILDFMQQRPALAA